MMKAPVPLNLLRSNFPTCNGKTGDVYFRWLSDAVTSLRGGTFQLQSPAGATLTVGPLEDTVYKDRPAEVNGWEEFFLPETVTMQVVGYATGTPYPCDQLVLMMCEDKKVYGYDEEEEELHVVADSWERLLEAGVDYPPSKSYYSGEAFKDMTREDWDEVRKGPVGRRLAEEHHQFVEKHKTDLLANLKISLQKQRCHQEHGKTLPNHVLSQLCGT